MNVNEMTFGCEFEVTVPRSLNLAIGSYSSGTQVPGLPTGWVAKHDGSIRARGGNVGVEIVSPVLKGESGVSQLIEVCAWFRRVGAKVNRTCGFHVHVGWTGDDAALARLAHIVANHEKAIYAATGTKSRERGGYCQPIRNNATYQQVFVNGQRGGIYQRYHVLNLTNLGRSNKNTVEFRAFPGTINLTKATAYICLSVGIVEKAMVTKRQPKWEPKPTAETSPIHRSGVGQTEVTRLMYALGWVKGRVKHVFGNLTAAGAPDLRRCKREFMRLARKYDSQP